MAASAQRRPSNSPAPLNAIPATVRGTVLVVANVPATAGVAAVTGSASLVASMFKILLATILSDNEKSFGEMMGRLHGMDKDTEFLGDLLSDPMNKMIEVDARLMTGFWRNVAGTGGFELPDDFSQRIFQFKSGGPEFQEKFETNTATLDLDTAGARLADQQAHVQNAQGN
ncbi:MAG: hypothetical protein ACJAUU_000282 [Rickettsiales bacterium]|jgi:hypothetical protein